MLVIYVGVVWVVYCFSVGLDCVIELMLWYCNNVQGVFMF